MRNRKEARHRHATFNPYYLRSNHMQIVYRTESRVINHINALRRAYGWWPGYIKVNGGYVLTFDPDAPSPDERERDEDGPWHD